MQGINLGGWIIPERWMSPSLFAGTDAVDLYSLLGRSDGMSRYQKHLDEWITEKDFAWLAEHNIQLLRLPVGFWAVSSDKHYPDISSTVDWAFAMAKKYHMQLLLDFHGAKGSQNGHDHSGRIGAVSWWQQQKHAHETLIALARRYGKEPVLWGIELINEPAIGLRYFSLLHFYRRAYRDLREVLPAGTKIVFHDGFMPLLLSGALWPRQSHPVVMDMHLYGLPAVFASNMRVYTFFQRLYFTLIIVLCRMNQDVMIGEWSGVLPQRLFDQYPEEQHIALVIENIARQKQLFHGTVATCYWNYKTEADGVWNYRSLE